MPEFLPPTRARRKQPDFHKLPSFVQGYLKAMFWTDCNDDDYDGEKGTANMGYANLPHKVLKKIVEECIDFQTDNQVWLNEAYSRGYDEEQAGHDFWLTRNHHGAGYWDRKELYEGGIGDKLTEACRAAGEVYVSANGRWLYHD